MCPAILAFRLGLSMTKNISAYPLDDSGILVMVDEEMREVCHGLRGLEQVEFLEWCSPHLDKPPFGAAFLLALLCAPTGR